MLERFVTTILWLFVGWAIAFVIIPAKPTRGQNIGLEQIKKRYGEWGSGPTIIIERKSTKDVSRRSMERRGYHSPGTFRPVEPAPRKEMAPPRSSGKGPYGLLPRSQLAF